MKEEKSEEIKEELKEVEDDKKEFEIKSPETFPIERKEKRTQI